MTRRMPHQQSLRVVVWNCRRAGAKSEAWPYLLALKPDLAFLQEVSAAPASVAERFRVLKARAVGKTGRPQRFSTITLSRIGEITPWPLQSPLGWAQDEIQNFDGNLVSGQIPGRQMRFVNVYSPAWPIDRGRLNVHDTSTVKLALNPDVWVADLVRHALSVISEDEPHRLMAAGDFNLSETFDSWLGGPRGNREYLDGMAAAGFVECLRTAQGELTPTFRNPRDGRIAHQMDHLFVSPDLASALSSCTVGDRDDVFGRSLSDHLPIIADFNLPLSVTGLGDGMIANPWGASEVTSLTQNLTRPSLDVRTAKGRKPASRADSRPMTRLGIEPRTY